MLVAEMQCSWTGNEERSTDERSAAVFMRLCGRRFALAPAGGCSSRPQQPCSSISDGQLLGCTVTAQTGPVAGETVDKLVIPLHLPDLIEVWNIGEHPALRPRYATSVLYLDHVCKWSRMTGLSSSAMICTAQYKDLLQMRTSGGFSVRSVHVHVKAFSTRLSGAADLACRSLMPV